MCLLSHYLPTSISTIQHYVYVHYDVLLIFYLTWFCIEWVSMCECNGVSNINLSKNTNGVISDTFIIYLILNKQS